MQNRYRGRLCELLTINNQISAINTYYSIDLASWFHFGTLVRNLSGYGRGKQIINKSVRQITEEIMKKVCPLILQLKIIDHWFLHDHTQVTIRRQIQSWSDAMMGRFVGTVYCLPPFSLIGDFGNKTPTETFPKFPSVLRPISQSQPLVWPSGLLYIMLAGCDW